MTFTRIVEVSRQPEDDGAYYGLGNERYSRLTIPDEIVSTGTVSAAPRATLEGESTAPGRTADSKLALYAAGQLIHNQTV